MRDRFTKRFAERVAALNVAPGNEDGAELGPMIDQAALTKMEGLVCAALSKGAKVVTGGDRHAREEIFGPVAPVYRFETEDEAIAAANDTDYGLAAYAYSKDLARMFRLQEQLEYGLIGIN